MLSYSFLKDERNKRTGIDEKKTQRLRLTNLKQRKFIQNNHKQTGLKENKVGLQPECVQQAHEPNFLNSLQQKEHL